MSSAEIIDVFQATAQPSCSTAPAQEVHAERPYTLLDRYSLWTDADDITQTRLRLGSKVDIAFDSQALTSGELIAALADQGLRAPDITALQRPRPGLFTISFADSTIKRRFVNLPNFTVNGHRPLIRDCHSRKATYVSIRNAPPELPDAAIIARLKSFGEITSFRRCLHPNSQIENGHRSARMLINTPIPSFLRLASETIQIIYAGQTKTCRKCHRPDHEARNCQNHACFNCSEVGHIAINCSEPTRCSICQSIAHKAYACPYAVIDRINPDVSISAALADALSHVPVIPTAPTTADETEELTDADTLDRLGHHNDTMDCTYTTNVPNNGPNNDPNEHTVNNDSPQPPLQELLRPSPTSSQETVKSSKASAPQTSQKAFKIPHAPAPKATKKPQTVLPPNCDSHDADDDDCRSTTSTKRKDRPPSSSDSDGFTPVNRRKSLRPKPILSGRKKK